MITPLSKNANSVFGRRGGRAAVRSEVTWPTIPAMVRDAARPLRRRRGRGRRHPAASTSPRSRRWSPTRLVRCSHRESRRGDRVAVWAPNSLEWIVAALGVTTAGGVLVPVNTRFRGAEAALRPRPQRRPRPVHGARLPRHRLPGAARRRRRSAPRARAHRPALRATPDDTHAVGWDEFLAPVVPCVTADVDAAPRVASAPTTRATSCSRRGRPGSPKGVVMTHGQTLRAYLDWCDWADLRAGRPLPDRRTRSSTSSATRPVASRR